jgi:hypothetical protein
MISKVAVAVGGVMLFTLAAGGIAAALPATNSATPSLSPRPALSCGTMPDPIGEAWTVPSVDEHGMQWYVPGGAITYACDPSTRTWVPTVHQAACGVAAGGGPEYGGGAGYSRRSPDMLHHVDAGESYYCGRSGKRALPPTGR